MNAWTAQTRRIPRSQRGVALVLTLAMLGILSLVVIGFLVEMRTEQNAARNSTYVIVARQMAQSAVDDALYLLRTNTPALSLTTSYITMAGAAVPRTTSGAPAYVTPQNNLFSYPAAFALSTVNVNTNDLNLDQSITPSNSLYTALTNRQIVVDWLYVSTNGTYSGTNDITHVVNTTPVLGRYAFWVDDEASKLNINSANQRVNLFGAVPSDVDLTVLAGINSAGAASTWNYAQTNGYFTVEQWQMTWPSASVGTIFSNNAFYITAYSTDDNLTPWGGSRLNLSDPSLSGTNLTICATQQLAVVSVNNCLTQAGLANWFGNQTFADKYGSATQIAANIVNWANPSVPPVDSACGNWADPTPPAYLGLTQTPYLNELVVSNTICITNFLGAPGVHEADLMITNTAVVELWYMYGGTWPPAAISGHLEVYLTNQPSIIISGGGLAVPQTNLPNAQTLTANLVQTPASPYVPTPAAPVYLPPTVIIPDTTTPLTITFNPGTITTIYRVNNVSPWNRIDYAQIPVPTTSLNFDLSALPLMQTLGAQTWNVFTVSACNDPRVKPMSSRAPNNWQTNSTLVATLGAANSVLNFSVSNTNGLYYFGSDGDISSHTNFNSTAGFDSIGSLGFIHTGWPWRTLMLQPVPPGEINAGTGHFLPDWAVLDLFTTTNGPVQGRVNINGVITNWGSGASLPRYQPLTGVIPGNMASYGFGPNTDQLRLATNIYNLAWANIGPSSWFYYRTNTTYKFLPGAFNMIGELCEVDGVSTNYAAATTDQMREARIRTFANLVTTRSDTFTIWGLGQAVDNNTNVMAETKFQVVVQRYVDSTATPPNVKFRTLYFRHLTP